MKLQALSINAFSFPTYLVEYEDMVGWRYATAGRSLAGVDCAGVILEIYRRAGLGLPDPARGLITEFGMAWEKVSAADTLYDLLRFRPDTGGLAGQDHLGVLVRPDVVLSATRVLGVHARPLAVYARIPRVENWRLKASVIPIGPAVPPDIWGWAGELATPVSPSPVGSDFGWGATL